MAEYIWRGPNNDEYKTEHKCPDCEEPVDRDGDTLTNRDCSYCLIICETCGDHQCDQSC